MKTILVVGRDWKFRALLRAQLREEGFDALGFETLGEAIEELTRTAPAPAVVVFDTTDATAPEKAQLAELAERLPVLLVASAQEPVEPARLRLLRRPVALGAVVREVKSLAGSLP